MFRKQKVQAEDIFDRPISSLRPPKGTKKLAITVIILFVLLLLVGAAYTYYMGQNTTPATNTPSNASLTVAPLPKPSAPAPTTKVSAAIDLLTSPVSPGSQAQMTIRTLPKATCSIAVIYNNMPGKDPGLTNKVADDYGTVGWTWTVSRSVPNGTWPVTVTCSYHGKSAVVQGNLEVTK